MSILSIDSADGPGGLAFPALRGMSAYEIAKKHGFKGTEEEWLSSFAAAKPLVLYAVRENKHPDMYLNDSTYGDEALKAILTGRQILVRTPGKGQVDSLDASYAQQHTALFSPVLTYHIPNYENDYLYLFYLRDEKQTIDLTAVGMGTIEVPVYGELKMKLSTKYAECPLEYKTPQEYGDLINT